MKQLAVSKQRQQRWTAAERLEMVERFQKSGLTRKPEEGSDLNMSCVFSLLVDSMARRSRLGSIFAYLFAS